MDHDPLDHTRDPDGEDDLATASELLHRSLATDGADMAADAVRAWRLIVAERPVDDAHRATALSGLGLALSNQFAYSGEDADVDAAIEAGREAVNVAGDDHVEASAYRAALAASVRARYDVGGAPEDLEALHQLVNEVRDRLEETGEFLDLDSMIAVFTQLLWALPDDDPDRPAHAFELATWRYTRAQATEDREAETAALQELRDVADNAESERAKLLTNIGALTMFRYVATGDADDLEVAIDAGRAAVESAAPGSPERVVGLGNLATGLRNRFDRHQGTLADLDTAIEMSREVAALLSADHPQWATTMFNSGAALHIRHAHAGRPEDLDAAVAALRAAVAAAPLGHSSHVMAWSSLGLALRSRFERTSDPADLDAAIEAGTRAVADTSPDDPDASRYQSNLDDSIMLRWCRGQASGTAVDVDRRDEFTGRFAARATSTVQTATEDAEFGLTQIDQLLGWGADVPVLAASVAQLRYNRAALHRSQDRQADARAGYLALSDEFETHPDPDVRFWVALAVYNAITLTVETEPDDAVAEVVPSMVVRLRAEAAGVDHPRVARRVREGMRAEVEILARLGRDEEAEAALDRLRELLRPAIDHVVAQLEDDDPVRPADRTSPQWPSSRAAIVSALFDRLDEHLDVVRGLADAEEADLIDLLAPSQELFTAAAIEMIAAAADRRIPGALGDADAEVLNQGLSNLAAVVGHLSTEWQAYPLGSGPVEELLQAVDVLISMADAVEQARTLPVVSALSAGYAVALAEAGSMALLAHGEWRQAFRLHQLLLAAAERQPNTDEGRAIVTIARYRWLWVARDVLVQLPDARVLHSATDAGERLLALPDAEWGFSGSRKDEVLFELASLHLSPHANLYTGSDDTTTILARYRRRLDRLTEEVKDPVELPDGAKPHLPDITESIDVGARYLRRALADAKPELLGPIRGLMLIEHKIRRELDHGADDGELAALIDAVVADTDADAYPHLLANALLMRLWMTQVPDTAAVDRLLSRPFDEVLAGSGGETATSLLMAAGQLLQITDPGRGRQLFAAAAEHVRGLDEDTRSLLLLVQHHLLVDPADLDVGEPAPGLHPRDATTALLDRAAAAGWPDDRTALAAIALTGRGHQEADDFAREHAWLRNLEVVGKVYPEFVAGHEDALTHLTAVWYAQASSRAHERGDWEHAVRAQAAACKYFLALGMPDAVMEALTLIAVDVGEAGGAGLATAAAESLWPLVVRAENLVGPPATKSLQAIWSQVVGAASIVDEASALFACLQLAKGARFADALHAGVTYDARADDTATQLLATIEQVADAHAGDVDLDAFTLVTPYTERLDVVGAATAAHQRENLERTFDAHVQRALSGPATDEPQLLGIEEMLDLLPSDTVLWSTYLAHSEDGSGGRSTVSVVARHGRFAVVTQQVLDAEGATQGVRVTVDDRVRMLDPMAQVVDRIRRATLAEPGPVRPVARASEDALADGLVAMFGPVADLLREEFEAGRRHLVVVPHGALHFAPMHLLYFDGKPLAETFTVTYLPNLALLARHASAPDSGEQSVCSVGLGFTDGTLPPIPEAVEEAKAIAAEYGARPLLDADATEEAVLTALERTRLFHIATHGRHNVAAPAFQSLYVADERVSAHELLRLDLSNLDLITLSACETALGRFDAGDNLRGIPANLLARGASAIVGTLWPVESHTSRDFFTALYGELRRGTSRLDAFATAQRRTRAIHPQYRDWGAFYYAGDWR